MDNQGQQSVISRDQMDEMGIFHYEFRLHAEIV